MVGGKKDDTIDFVFHSNNSPFKILQTVTTANEENFEICMVLEDARLEHSAKDDFIIAAIFHLNK